MNSNGSKKRNDFLKKLGIGVATATAIGAIGAAAYESNPDRAKEDLAKYADNGNKIIDYIDENDESKLTDVKMMDEYAKKYKELSGKMFLSDEEKIELENIKEAIRNEILSDDLSEIYLEDIFKGKVKSAYSAEYVEVRYTVNNNAEEFMAIDVYEVKPTSKLDKPDVVIKQEEMPKEVKAAIGCIVDFQEFAECNADQIKDGSISRAVKEFESMKGFANMDLTKNEKGKMEVKKPEKEIEK